MRRTCMYHSSSSSYNEPVPIVVQQYDVGSAFHALVGILDCVVESRARQQQQQSERRISSQKIIILYDAPAPTHIARSARLFSEACYYSAALAHPAKHWSFCHTEDLRSGCLLKRVFSVSIYFRSVRSLQVQPFLVLSSNMARSVTFLLPDQKIC